MSGHPHVPVLKSYNNLSFPYNSSSAYTLFSTVTSLLASSYRILKTIPSMELHMILVTTDTKYDILVIKNSTQLLALQ
jgi:hypothetical protein